MRLEKPRSVGKHSWPDVNTIATDTDCERCGNTSDDCVCVSCDECGEVFDHYQLVRGLCSDCFDPSRGDDKYDKSVDDEREARMK